MSDGVFQQLGAEVVRAAAALGPLWAVVAILAVAALFVLVRRVRLLPSDPPPSRTEDVAPADPPSVWGDNVVQGDVESGQPGGG